MKEAASACRVKLDDAIKQLRTFIEDVSFAIDYNEKQKFLVQVNFSTKYTESKWGEV